MHDYRSNWNEPFSPLGPAIKPKREPKPCPLLAFERGSFEVEGEVAPRRVGVDLTTAGLDVTTMVSVGVSCGVSMTISGSSYDSTMEEMRRQVFELRRLIAETKDAGKFWNS